MGQGVVPAQGAVGKEDARKTGACDPRCCSYSPGSECPPVLVHRSARHPVGSNLICPRLPDCIGKCPAPRDDQQGAGGRSQGRDDLPACGARLPPNFTTVTGDFFMFFPCCACTLISQGLYSLIIKREDTVSFSRSLSVFMFLCLCVVSCGAVQIIEFCPDPYLADDADEYVVLSGIGSLDGVAIADNHGGFRFPDGTFMNGTLTVARDGPAFEKTHGSLPDFEWQDHSPQVPDVISRGTLRLANSRDELLVYENSRLVQKITWPGDVRPREGQVHFLENGVWDPRPLMLGQSRLLPETFENVTVTAFVSPDSSLDSIFQCGCIGTAPGAGKCLRTLKCQYHGRPDRCGKTRGGCGSPSRRGPVGGISPEEKAAIWRLNQSGIPVY